MLYLAAFAAALLVDTIPVFAPPAWTILAFMIIKWKLNPWGIIATGALGSVIGRYILTLYMPHVSAKIFRRSENANISFLGKKLGGRFWSRQYLRDALRDFAAINHSALHRGRHGPRESLEHPPWLRHR